jgi:hypothetical protein
VEVGLHRTDTGDFDVQVGFFFKLANNSFVNIFIILYVAAGDAPQALVAAVPPAQQEPPLLIQYHRGHSDDGIFVEDIAAVPANQPVSFPAVTIG